MKAVGLVDWTAEMDWLLVGWKVEWKVAAWAVWMASSK